VCPAGRMHPVGYPIGYVFLHDWSQLSCMISRIIPIRSRRIIFILQKSYRIKHILQEYACVSCRMNASYRISCRISYRILFLHDWNPLSYKISRINAIGYFLLQYTFVYSHRIIFIFQKSYSFIWRCRKL